MAELDRKRQLKKKGGGGEFYLLIIEQSANNYEASKYNFIKNINLY